MKVKIVGTPTKKVKIVDVPQAKNGGDKWIKGAVNPKHKGYCTPMTKSTCTPARKAFAKRAKKHFHQTGGEIPETQGLPDGLHDFANIEAEAGEIYQDKSGKINKISDQAPSHEQGGAMISNAHRVLEDTSMDRKDKASKTLQMSPDEIETIFGIRPKRGLSHAKAFEYIKAEYGKEVDRFNESQKGLNEKPNFDRIKYNTAKLNFNHREEIPTDEDVFNTLFEHQEAIKAVHGIQNDGKNNKYGGYMQAGGSADDTDLGLYRGPKYPTAANLYTPTGKTSEAKLSDKQIAEAYKAVGVDFTGLRGGKLQTAIYNYLIDNQPDVLRQTLKEYGANRKAINGKAANLAAFKDPENASAADLKKALPYLVDNMPGARIPLPSSETDTPPGSAKPAVQGITPPAPAAPVAPASPAPGDELTPGPGGRVNNRFFEPTHWYDLAPGLAELTDAMRRDPELYDPVQIHQLRYKLLNPTAALNANNEDYEAALHAFGNENLGSGARAANVANATAQKYKSNNQILAEYENQNAGIKNSEISYNTQALDRQSMADASSRREFYSNVLRARDNQRLQKLQAIQDLSRVQQLKARQNASGNLILQTTPHFNQEGEYNGNQYIATLPPELGDGTFIPQTGPQQKQPVSKATTRTTWKIGDKTYTTTVQNPNQ